MSQAASPLSILGVLFVSEVAYWARAAICSGDFGSGQSFLVPSVHLPSGTVTVNIQPGAKRPGCS